MVEFVGLSGEEPVPEQVAVKRKADGSVWAKYGNSAFEKLPATSGDIYISDLKEQIKKKFALENWPAALLTLYDVNCSAAPLSTEALISSISCVD